MSDIDRKVFSVREKVLLMSLVEKYKNILENKKTDAIQIQQKNEAWNKITQFYNSNDVSRRTTKQLKKLWDNLKQKTRKSDTEFKNKMLKTGGGPSSKVDDDPLNVMVRSIVPTINFMIDNKFDSNAAYVEQRKHLESSSSPEVAPVPVDEGSVIEMEEDDIIRHEQFPLDLDYEIQHDVPNRNDENVTLVPDISKKNSRKTKNNNISLVEKESQLRLTKLENAIQQQTELHKMKLEAAEAEKLFWIKKTQLLDREDSSFNF